MLTHAPLLSQERICGVTAYLSRIYLHHETFKDYIYALIISINSKNGAKKYFHACIALAKGRPQRPGRGTPASNNLPRRLTLMHLLLYQGEV